MRWLLSTHMHNARAALRSNRPRAILTSIGVAIGVASITAVMALGAGASQIVSQEVNALGGNIAVIRPTSPATNSLSGLTQLQAATNFTSSSLTLQDVTALQSLPNIAGVAPLMTIGGTIKGDTLAPSGDSIVATTPDLLTVSSLKMDQGQFLDPTLDPNTLVMGPQLAVDIFGTDLAVGRSVQIRGHQFTVVGILARSNQPINYNGINFDTAAIMSIDSVSLIGAAGAQIEQINLKSDSVDHLQAVVASANQTMLRNHLGQPDFQILAGNAIAEPSSQLFLVIAGVTAAVAAISLLVGGIGIMNIMLVNVAERTREIGLRKALGARHSDIIWQFLIEAIIISFSGGVAGYALGYAVAFVLSLFVTFDPVLDWQIAVVALGVSLVTGIIFGLYPAWRAARKDPIRALRHYD